MLVQLYDLLGRLYHLIYDLKYRLIIKSLIARGLKLGKNVTIAPTAYLDRGYPYLISIGNNCSLANDVRLLVHDATTFKFLNQHTRLGKIEIKDNCFIGERAIILPGVTIGPNVLVAAGSLVNHDIPPNSCVAGVPARVYAKFDEFLERNRQQMAAGDIFELSLLEPFDLAKPLQAQVQQAVQNGHNAYVHGPVRHDPFTWNIDQEERAEL